MSFFKVQNREKNGDKSNTSRFPSCLKPLFQSKAKCEAIDTNMILYSRANEAHFQKKCFALCLVVYKPRAYNATSTLLSNYHFSPSSFTIFQQHKQVTKLPPPKTGHHWLLHHQTRPPRRHHHPLVKIH